MKQVQKPRKPLIVYYLIAIAVLILFNSFVFPAIVGGNVEEVDYGTFLTMVEYRKYSSKAKAFILQIKVKIPDSMKLRGLMTRIL